MSKNNLKLDKLKNEIGNLVNKYCNNSNVECIYFIPFIENDEMKFELTIVFSNKEDLSKIDNEISRLNKKYNKQINDFGGKLVLYADKCDNYSICAMHSYEVRRVKDLLSSTIIFDRSGKYNKIAHQFDQDNTMEKYDNIFEVDIDIQNNDVKQYQIRCLETFDISNKTKH